MSVEIAEQPSPPLVRVWDKDFNLIGYVGEGWRIDQPDVLAVPLAHPIGQWLLSADRHGPVTLTADYDGLRYVGGLYEIKVMQEEFGGGKVKHIKAAFDADRVTKLSEWLKVVDARIEARR